MFHIKICGIDAKVKSKRMSFYGLELTDATFDYAQCEGTGHIRSMNSSFYGGSMSANGKVEWMTGDMPYSFSFNVKDAKLEQYKKDTEMKDKDISGIIKLYASINGSLKNDSALNGLGNISITKGRLWQLDLFKGIGAVIFTSNFSDIVFAEGYCDFKIKDKAFSTDNLSLKSDELNLYGSGKVGFDKSISAILKSELTEDAMTSGLRKNIAAAIGKYSVIEVSGTLKDPKYNVRPSMSDIIEDVATVFNHE